VFCAKAVLGELARLRIELAMADEVKRALVEQNQMLMGGDEVTCSREDREELVRLRAEAEERTKEINTEMRSGALKP
jgi:hypothetical protein